MPQAFYTGVSGIKSTQTAIDISSDNIANISTVGYRGQSVEFASMFENMLNTPKGTSNNNTIGFGTKVQATSMNELEGTLTSTDSNTDLAIEGEGWFGVTGSNGMLFTRAGDFKINENADLVTNDGSYVLGTIGNNIADGVLTSHSEITPLGAINAQEKLNFPTLLRYPQEATQNVSFFANLGNEGIEKNISARVIDPEGNKNNLSVKFSKSETQVLPGSQWDVVATTTGTDGVTIHDAQSGVLSFDEYGVLQSSTLESINNNGANVNIDFGIDGHGILASSAKTTEGTSIADGTIGGDLLSYDIGSNGEVLATFTNGQQSSVGKIALYHFANDQGLERAGGSTFRQSSNSGEALFYTDANGQNINGSKISNNMLESSNVKMEVALTELIVLQRSFDSSSKIVTAADEMLRKAIDMGA